MEVSGSGSSAPPKKIARCQRPFCRRPKQEMFFLQDHRRRSRFDSADEKKRLRIALTKGLEQFVPAKQVPVHFPQAQLGIQMQARLERSFTKVHTTAFFERSGENRKVFLSNRQASRHLVSAKFFQQIVTLAEHGNQRQTRDTSAAAFAKALLVKADNDGRPMMILGDARSDDAEHARMPAALAKHDRRRFRKVGRGDFFLCVCDRFRVRRFVVRDSVRPIRRRVSRLQPDRQ